MPKLWRGRVIYEPKGRAGEYAGLALNVATNCIHGCKYCYVPAMLRKTAEEFHEPFPKPKPKLIENLIADLDTLAARGDEREILLSFCCDPYQTETIRDATSACLKEISARGFKATVLTKAKPQLAIWDAQRFADNGWRFGVTLSFNRDGTRYMWEPNASTTYQRFWMIRYLSRQMGIRVWVSVEPVIDPRQALEVIRDLRDDVYEWRIGKINHHPEIEEGIDWAAYLQEAEELLEGRRYVIKHDLLKFKSRTTNV